MRPNRLIYAPTYFSWLPREVSSRGGPCQPDTGPLYFQPVPTCVHQGEKSEGSQAVLGPQNLGRKKVQELQDPALAYPV